MSQFINYVLTVRNQGEIVPQVDGQESEHGQFTEKLLRDIKHCLSHLHEYKSWDDFVYFGEKLFEASLETVKVSFEGQVWSRYIRSSDTTHLRMRIIFEEIDPETTRQLVRQTIDLPWEFLCYPGDNHCFLGTHPRVALSCGYKTWLNHDLKGYAVRESPLRVLFVHTY